MSDDTLLSLEDDGGRPVDTLLALAELPRAVRSTHAHLSVRQTAIAEAYRQRGARRLTIGVEAAPRLIRRRKS